ncbi:MAG: glycosyltransferase [Methylophilaceae bacterium]|nr:glycosyltransferase [Methylophilaceae bacterium]
MNIEKIPAVSVIMPIYNTFKYIDEAIESVLNQTFTDFELLLLNDGSTDGSLARLEHYAGIDSRCKLLTSANSGIVATRNKGVALARAEILINMDSDDICLPNRFQTQVDYLKQHPECVAAGSKILLIDSDGLPILQAGNLLTHDEIDTANMSGNGLVMFNPAVAMRKSVVVAVGAYKPEFEHAEDLDLFLRMAEVGKLANISQILLHYRQHVASVGYAKRQSQVSATKVCVLEAYARRHLSPPSELVNSDPQTYFHAPDLFEIHSKWSWWALGGGYAKTARVHAWKAFLSKPFSISNLKLYLCAIRGY